MKFIFDYDTWQEIFDSIKKSKLRTAITVIGVLWGIFLFITLLGAAKGMENGFDREFSTLATNSIFLWGERTTVPYKGFQRGRFTQLKFRMPRPNKKTIPGNSFCCS
ncbi:MAG: ABC transporter permease [Flavobacteriaceae bacterium]|nr:ABC transporter permease [Flavobacteriaceae bacterium]